MTKEAEKLGKTGERMVPELHKGKLIYAEHLLRYQAADSLVKGKVVLDIACGSGYGTKLLAQNAKKVYGVDIDKDTVAYAEKHYGAKNIEYRVGDGESIPLEDNSVDVVITFETIEHIKDYKRFMDEVRRVLKPDGLAVVSTPNDLEFAEGNHYHLHEFTYDELKDMLKKDFKYIDSYYQATWKYVAIGDEKSLRKEGPVTMPLESYSAPNPDQYLYFYLLCSNRKITERVESKGALGEHFSDRHYIGIEMQHEQNLKDYKKVVSELQRKVESLAHENQSLNSQLLHIRNSKVYQAARRLRNLSHRDSR